MLYCKVRSGHVSNQGFGVNTELGLSREACFARPVFPLPLSSTEKSELLCKARCKAKGSRLSSHVLSGIDGSVFSQVAASDRQTATQRVLANNGTAATLAGLAAVNTAGGAGTRAETA